MRNPLPEAEVARRHALFRHRKPGIGGAVGRVLFVRGCRQSVASERARGWSLSLSHQARLPLHFVLMSPSRTLSRPCIRTARGPAPEPRYTVPYPAFYFIGAPSIQRDFAMFSLNTFMRQHFPSITRARARARDAAGNERPWPADKVERWGIDRLIPYAKNARTHTDAQVAAIAASIKEWG